MHGFFLKLDNIHALQNLDFEILALASGTPPSMLASDRSISIHLPSAALNLVHPRLSQQPLGSQETCFNSIANLRTQGRQVQVGLMAGEDSNPAIPMHLVIAKELSIHGSHGMQAYRYPAVFEMIKSGKLHPEWLIRDTICLEEVVEKLPEMNTFSNQGVTVINQF